eukprot:4274784-Prorocentrum_lima.AAC.1
MAGGLLAAACGSSGGSWAPSGAAPAPAGEGEEASGAPSLLETVNGLHSSAGSTTPKPSRASRPQKPQKANMAGKPLPHSRH